MKILKKIICYLCLLTSIQLHADISYHIEVTDPAHHLATVSIEFPNVTTKTLEVKLPVWRSGRYEILNLSKAISDFTAEHGNGSPINWIKTNKNTWKLMLNQPGPVTVRYQVYANTLRYRVAHIDPTHAFLDASGVFMFSPAFREQPLTVELKVPKDWRSRSGMTQTGFHSFRADDYDILVDSPIESGLHQFLSFRVDDQTYEIVIWGEGNHDIYDLQKHITALHHVGKELWGNLPFERYVYMYHAGDGIRGATEHLNSTIIQQDRFNFKPRASYLKVLATTAHEFVHTWNVKAYRPAGIAPYDYSQENYSDLFWMAEGITSYYDDLFLMRAGIYTPEEYLDKLATDIKSHLKKPGRHVESLQQTSFDTWLKDNTQRTHNASVSIYLEGSLTAWLLDQRIRQLTDNRFSLDELQRRLYQDHHNSNQGYTTRDVLTVLKDITGQDMQKFWSTHVEGTGDIDFDELLAFYGLHKVNTASDSEPASWMGAELETQGGLLQVKTVDRDGPAWLAGLTAGDQLIAINDLRLDEKNWSQRVSELSIGQSHEVHYFSAGRLRTTTLTPASDPHPDFSIEPVKKPTREQQRRFKAWTGQSLSDLTD
ncbi:M61 family metallopeptidase [Marinicella sediminis]|uniref:M61 family metallopeptidase n=1 Tax=Marinicella sediminis TaxID=1792834 RepID=A0ABV7JAF2_9GAMM|nr:PDZ domain-containing protein [Marinicella sediminis]